MSIHKSAYKSSKNQSNPSVKFVAASLYPYLFILYLSFLQWWEAQIQPILLSSTQLINFPADVLYSVYCTYNTSTQIFIYRSDRI